jgi:hypothetical protein
MWQANGTSRATDRNRAAGRMGVSPLPSHTLIRFIFSFGDRCHKILQQTGAPRKYEATRPQQFQGFRRRGSGTPNSGGRSRHTGGAGPASARRNALYGHSRVSAWPIRWRRAPQRGEAPGNEPRRERQRWTAQGSWCVAEGASQRAPNGSSANWTRRTKTTLCPDGG